MTAGSSGKAAFHDADDYERLVDVARAIDRRTLLIVLLGGDAGLRCGEMIALEWCDVDLAKRQLCVRQSDWNGQVGTPKSGRLRYLPLTERLAAALAEHRHLRSKRVLCQDDGKPFTRQIVQNRMILAAKRATVRKGIHILRHTFCSLLAMRGAPARAIQELAGHADLTMTQRYMHLSPAALADAIRLLDRPGGETKVWRRGGDGVPDVKMNKSGHKTGGEAGIRMRWATICNLLMARDFWLQRIESLSLVWFPQFSAIFWRTRESTEVLETWWRRFLRT